LVAFGSLLLGLALAEPVLGQYSEVQYRRPSSDGPSNRVGITGGVGTRDIGVGSRQAVLGGRRGGDPAIVRMPSREELQRGSRLPPNLMPAAFLMGTPGFAVEGRTDNPFRLPNLRDQDRISRYAGLKQSLQHSRPLLPDNRVYPIMAKGPYYAVESNRDRGGFSGLFDLSPSDTDEPTRVATPDEPILTYGELLERENAAYLQRSKDRAAAAFKKGTNPKQENRGEHLAQAADLLAQVMRTDFTDPTPALLAVHTALERDYMAVAQRSLLDLVFRDPEIFSHEPDVAKYFGDARALENQMRRFRRAGENTRDPSAWALQAYCSWVLGDAAGTQIAVKQMLDNNRQGGNSPQIRVFGYALSAALSAATD
jgi:hypothetical protein